MNTVSDGGVPDIGEDSMREDGVMRHTRVVYWCKVELGRVRLDYLDGGAWVRGAPRLLLLLGAGLYLTLSAEGGLHLLNEFLGLFTFTHVAFTWIYLSISVGRYPISSILTLKASSSIMPWTLNAWRSALVGIFTRAVLSLMALATRVSR